MAQKVHVPKPPEREDSGLIDLRALMAQAAIRQAPRTDEAERTPLPVVRPLAIYPLGPIQERRASEPAPPPPPFQSRAIRPWMAVTGGLTILLLTGGVTALLLSRGGSDSPRATAREISVVAASSPPVADLQGTPEALPTSGGPAVTAAQSATVEIEPPKAPRSAGPASRPVAVSTRAKPPPRKTPSTTAASAAPPKAPAPADTCHGDLLCAMKRATGGR